MKVLLFGVLMGLLQGGLHEVYYHKPLYFAKYPHVVKGPFGLVQPVVRDYYRPIYSNPEHPQQHQNVQNLNPDYYYAPQEDTPFHRGHIEAVPNYVVSVKSADYDDEGRIPLRDAVERIPIEGQMNILLKSNTEDNGDENPFSRSHVEAFPEPQVPYSFEGSQSINSMVYSSYFAQKPKQDKDFPLIGYRSDVESPPRSPNVNIFTYYRSPNPRISNLDDQWNQQITGEFSPSIYKSWNSPVTFRTNDGDKKVVCFYASWAVYRPKPLDFDIKDIYPFACTHVIYAFAGLDNHTLTITSLDRNRDVVQGAYKSLVSLKARNPDLRLLIGVGGYEEGGIKFSDMVSTGEKRQQFIDSVVSFIEEHGFDGLDLNWEYPGAPDRGGSTTDKMNLAMLLEQLYPIFKQKGWTLTMAAPIDKARIDSGYDIPRFANNIDFFNLMTYDLRGPFEGVADHHAPLQAKSTDSFIHKGLNLKEGIQLFVDYGAPKYKLVIGVPFYGRSFTLQDPKETIPGSKIINLGREGRYTRQKGYLAFYEICMEHRNGGWILEEDEAGGPYMSKDNQWVGYDNEDSIETKVNYIKHENLGGVMLWSLDLDDYLGLCGTRWPLLSALRRALHTPKTTTTTSTMKSPTSMNNPSPDNLNEVEKSSSDSEDKKSSVSIQNKKSSTSDIIGTNIDPAENFVCTGPGYYRNEYSCKVYFVCDERNKAYRFECPDGMAFDLHRRLCSWKDNVSCGKGYSPLVQTREIICKENGLFSDPTNCKNYIWCKDGDAIILPCPQDLLFNSRTGTCTSKNETFCIAGEMAKATGGNLRSFKPELYNTNFKTRADEFIVVCYFSNWAWLRPTEGAFYPEHVDPNLCTHVIYAFSVLDSLNFKIRSPDPFTDLENGFYPRVLALRKQNPNLKVLLSLGGWTDSSGDKYSRLVNNPEARASFVSYTVHILTSYEFDGLDLHWEYPVCWQIDCSRGPSTDKQGFAALVRELRQAFIQQPVPLILSAAISPARAIIARAYDVRSLSANLDFFNVMTYDYHGFWEKKTGHVSPLFYRQDDKYDSQNTDFSINFLIQSGADPKKLVVGIPFYGQTFKLANPGQNTLNDPVVGPGNSGPVTMQKGMLSYAEICQKIRTAGWRKATDNAGAIGPFATKDDQWISFDDPDMISKKGKYIRNTGLGGAMVWSLDFDDFQNFCCKEPMPLLRALNRELRSIPYPPPRPGGDCSKPPPIVTPPTATRTTTYSGGKPTKPTTVHGDIDITSSTKRTTFWSEMSKSTTSSTTYRTTQSTYPWQTTRRTTPSTTTTTTTTRKPTTRYTTTTTATTTTTTRPTTRQTSKAPKTPTSQPFSQDQIQPGSSCSSSGFKPHSSDCSKFFSCVQGKYKENSCAPGLHWNNNKQICDWPNNAQCSIGSKMPTTSWYPSTTRTPHQPQTTSQFITTTTTRPTTTQRTTRRTTWWWRPSSTESTTTRRTTWWKPHHTTMRTTPTRWKQPTSTFMQTVPTTEVNINQPFGGGSSPEQPGSPCNSKDFVPHPSDCGKFLRCQGKKLKEIKCAPGLHWNSLKNICDWPDSAQCRSSGGSFVPMRSTTIYPIRTTAGRIPIRTSLSPSPPPPPPPPPEPTIRTTRQPQSSISQKCSGHETKNVLGYCSKYYQCVNGKFLLRDCPPGLQWNQRISHCDWPDSVNCVVSVRATPPSTSPLLEESPEAEPSQGPQMGDSCSGSMTVKLPYDCGGYLMCDQGKYIEFKCAKELHWNDRKKTCDWPNEAKCKKTKRPQKIPVTASDVSIPTTLSPSPSMPQPLEALEPAPPAGPLSGDYMVVCYFTNWAWYRPGLGKYTPDDIDESTCTHIVYGFAVLDYTDLTIKPHDTWADIDNHFYEKVTAYRAKGIKVTIAIGGWNDSEGDKYSRLVNSPSARAKFINHVIGFIKQHNFEGLDLDWEYPVCWQVDCDKGPASDKENFGIFVKELSNAFKPHGLLLSAAVSPSKIVIDMGYDVPTINQYLDWIAVMTYDFHGHWDKKTGHVAPMYYYPDDEYDYFNMDYAIRYWIEKGADKKKIVLGMPLYGQSFTLDDPSVNGLNAPANQKGLAGEYTRAAGFLAYYEICKHLLYDDWTVVRDPEFRMGPYAYKGNQWVSFDDVATIRKKSQYIRENGLGGGMVWALDLDDFTNQCGQGKYPLMKTIQSILGPADSSSPGMEPESQPMPMPESSTKVSMEMGTEPQGGYKVVCYYTNWSWYRQGEGKYVPEDIDSSLCTHINYGFVVLDSGKLVMKPHDSWADIDNNFYTRVTEFKKMGAKVLIALGGWNDSQGDKYSRLVNNPQARQRFNEHALSFIQQYGFDGLDLDWEYPKCWQVDCKKGPASDKQGFTDWIRELNTLFKPYGYLLTAAVSPSYKVMEHAYDVPALSRYLDFINVMTYDYHGQWDKITGHVSPMYAHPDDMEMKFNTDFTINHWIELGADPQKLIMGMPMYGQSFTLAQSKDNGLNQKSYGGGEAGPYTRARGFLAYYEICYFIKHQSWTVIRDPLGTMGPYAHRGNQWVGFDDIPQIRYKSEYIKQKGLGGAMIWALDLDDFKNRCGCEHHPLLKTINRVLRNFPSAAQECPLLGAGSQGEETGSKTTLQPIRTTERRTTTTTTFTRQPFTRPQVQMTKLPMTTSRRPMQDTTSPRPRPPPPPSSTQTGGGIFGMEGDKCMAGEFKRHADCAKFYECYKEMLREVSCYPGLHFDGMGRCRIPSEANCKGTRLGPQPPTAAIEPVIPQIITRPEIPVVPGTHHGVDITDSDYGTEGSACSLGQFKRHLRCDRFYQCLHGKLTERRCLPGLDWDGQGKCAWPEKAGCKKSAPVFPVPPMIDVEQPMPFTTPATTTTTTSTTTRRPTSTQWYDHWTPSTEATTPKPTHPPGSLEIDGYKVVCYFTNWAWYRQRVAKYKPEDIDPELCTHIIYGFAVLDSNTLLIKPHDTWADYDNKFYQKVTSLKAKGIRVLLAIGGWNDSKGDKYSRLVNNPNSRAKFIEQVVQFIEKHNFDGLDLDWEYPKCWQVDCELGPESDKDAFSAWIKELRAAFTPRNWLLTAAVSPSYKVIDAGYHVRDLTTYLDFVNVMTYDYHGHWDKQTGHVAPMLHYSDSIAPEFNANYTINYFIQHGANPRKLIMGMPMYGQSFTLMSPSNTNYNSPARKGQAGEYTRAAGFLAYYEICHDILNKGYTVVKDPSGSIGPYAHRGNQWVGFDDINMIRFKSEYIKNMGLGGGMIWALDLDDFNNRCNCESHPLLKTINRVLRNYPPASVDCSLG